MAGRFGTGFLATHVLSKTVKMDGDIGEDKCVKDFAATMHRDDRKPRRTGTPTQSQPHNKVSVFCKWGELCICKNAGFRTGQFKGDHAVGSLV